MSHHRVCYKILSWRTYAKSEWEDDSEMIGKYEIVSLKRGVKIAPLSCKIAKVFVHMGIWASDTQNK